MNNLLIYIISVIFSVNQTTTTLVTTRTYKFDYTSTSNKKLTDYIQLVFQNNLMVKGKYFGNDDNFHFVADIKFDENTENDNFSFTLTNYKFCKEVSNPYSNANYFVLKDLPFNLKEKINFSGFISGKQLILQRAFWYYDSQVDKIIFKSVEE